MSDNNLLEAISHGILVATGLYCLYQVRDANLLCLYISYGLIVVNNIIAVISWATDYNSRIQKVQKLAAHCQLLLVLPCITTQVWLQQGYPKEWSWTWAVIPVFPLICYIADADFDIPFPDIIVVCNLIGLGYAAFVADMKQGIAGAVCYGLAHVYIKHTALHNYMLCFFAYFALRTLGFGQNIF